MTFFDAFGYARRRELLAQCHPVYCPACGATQVQLRHWFTEPAEWRCRECKQEFIYEPRKLKTL